MVHGQPEFLYRIDQLDVRHQITFQPEEDIIVQKFFLSKIKAKGATAKNPTKNLTALKVNGPISSIPVS